jgi:hypothetical protein
LIVEVEEMAQLERREDPFNALMPLPQAINQLTITVRKEMVELRGPLQMAKKDTSPLVAPLTAGRALSPMREVRIND